MAVSVYNFSIDKYQTLSTIVVGQTDMVGLAGGINGLPGNFFPIFTGDNRYFTWQYSEKAFAGDVGVVGQRVDLWMPNETMCYTFGRRPCWVYVIP